MSQPEMPRSRASWGTQKRQRRQKKQQHPPERQQAVAAAMATQPSSAEFDGPAGPTGPPTPAGRQSCRCSCCKAALPANRRYVQCPMAM
eukprot:3889211-Alexandrium_andersonii.AAC.1